MSVENILVRFEGGVGDCLLGNRLLRAVMEKHPESSIKVVFDTGGNSRQEELMKSLWPSIYRNTYTLGDKLSPQHLVSNLNGQTINDVNHPDNLPVEFKEDIEASDLYFDLHVASLKFLRYDIPWQKYYSYFPKPEKVKKYEGDLPNKFIMVHLYPRPNNFHSLDQEYSIKLIEELKKILPVVVICQSEHQHWYRDCSDWIIDPTFEEIFDIASRCEIFFGADSSVRYTPLHYGKPSFVMSHHCKAPFTITGMNLAHLVRWSVLRNHVLPADLDPTIVSKICNNYLSYSGYYLIPEVSDGLISILNDNLPL
jgi:hypothetical protein